MRMINILIFLIIFILMTINVFADAGHPEHSDFGQAEGILNAEIPCDSLTEQQKIILGEYFMEQMHPGEAHIQMDEMMGGEGSESLKQAHINMADKFYCNKENAMMSGGMNGMMNYGGFGMMNAFGRMFLWTVLFLFVVFAIFWFVKNNEKENPLSILEKKYAKGEIDKDKFKKAKKLLKD